MFNYKILLCLIGVSLPAIYSQNDGGRDARIFKSHFDLDNKYTYHVAILQVSPANHSTLVVCGGGIIGDQYVLTAAHCIYGLKKSEIIIRSGWNVSPDQPHEEHRSYHNVSKIMYPKSYFHSYCRHHQNDIAILKLDKHFDFAVEDQFKKLQLPQYDNDYENHQVILTGYGIQEIIEYVDPETNEVYESVPYYADKLKYMITSVMSAEDCQRVANVIVSDTTMCTPPSNLDGFSCVGDGGGPLVYDDVVIGIRNSPNNYCIHKEPELYTRVSSYLGFINKVLSHDYSNDIVYI